MSELIKHECGMAFVRLLKPLSFYQKKYGTSLYGLTKLQLLMQKQRNRGQDGAGVVTVKINPDIGTSYMDRLRTNKEDNLKELFEDIYSEFKGLKRKNLNNANYLKTNLRYTGEVLMGHLRYGTHSGNSMKNVHPVIRRSNWKTRTLALAGNFNLTNVDELFDELISYGQHPSRKSDTITVLEKIGHFLDREVQQQFDHYKSLGHNDNNELTELISKNLDVTKVLSKASRSFDGGFVIGGIIGNGDAFLMRDPNSIRPAYYYQDDEVVVAASERPAIQTTFNISYDKIQEIPGGHVLVVKNDGRVIVNKFTEPKEKKSCSFERIYFSRGTDRDIYNERKQLGYNLTESVLETIDYDLSNTIFSYIPNTANVAFYGLVEGLKEYLNEQKLLSLKDCDGNKEKIAQVFNQQLRLENLIVKDLKLRTFITKDNSRNELVSHVYDVTYGIVKDNEDTVVLIDDSIVRGTTLKDSIITIVSRLNPKKIIVLSSAPQIRYPDCYGIDMSRMKEFIAFRALVELIKESGQESKLTEVYNKCKAQENLPSDKIVNEIKSLYDLFSYEDISKKITELVTPEKINCEVEIIYQTIENLHDAIPEHTGDWYFTGDYPTPGGNKVVNKAFINFIEGIEERSY
ncbi:MAG: amidophosphoribosyltransferase [Saprospiraceae bacterium]